MLQVWGRMGSSWLLPGYSRWRTKWVRSGFSSLLLFPGHPVRAGLQPCSFTAALRVEVKVLLSCAAQQVWDSLPCQQERKNSMVYGCLLKISSQSKPWVLFKKIWFICLLGFVFSIVSDRLPVPSGMQLMPGRKDAPQLPKALICSVCGTLPPARHWTDVTLTAWPETSNLCHWLGWVWFCWSRWQGEAALCAKTVVPLHGVSAGGGTGGGRHHLCPTAASASLHQQPGEPGLPKKTLSLEHFQVVLYVPTKFLPACWSG